MSFYSARLIGKEIISENENLLSIDLSNNHLQKNMKPIVDGILSDRISFEELKSLIDLCPSAVLNKQVSDKYAGQQVLSFCQVHR